jgi:GNAT superfamily N-acetyltransferase
MNTKAQKSDQFEIKAIGFDSPFFEEVIRLHAAGKGTLGPFPRGAFEDHAHRNLILVAIAPSNEIGGYLLYRVAKNRAAIVHLTTAESFRGKGIARLLVDSLKSKTTHLLGICLRCRRDYNISDMWEGFGFTVRHSKEGRGADGAILDYWWFDHNHEDLFSQAEMRDDASERALTAIDANVFLTWLTPTGHMRKILAFFKPIGFRIVSFFASRRRFTTRFIVHRKRTKRDVDE